MKNKAVAIMAIASMSLIPFTSYADSIESDIMEPVTNTVDSAATEVSDTAVTTQVKAVLAAQPGLPSSGISVTTIHGVVYLEGTVKTQKQVDDAIDMTKKVIGVKSVDAKKLRVTN